MRMDRILDWTLDHPVWSIAGFMLLVTGLVFAASVALSGSKACPRHQHPTVVTWVPIVAGKVTTMSPVYGCTR